MMREAALGIDVAKTTLGGALKSGPMTIPPHQREYSWKPSRVRKLLDDFQNAMIKKQSSYFLGTIVLTPGRVPSVIDGQQRLATAMIFLSAVRDAFMELGKSKDAKSIEDDFLFTYDRQREEDIPRLTLNTDDRAFMKTRILDRPEYRDDNLKARLYSHKLLDKAAQVAAERVGVILSSADKLNRKVDALKAWVDFIDEQVVVVMLTPPNAGRAFQMFKTLNDRAQKTTQADMLKNHLFELAEDSIDEAQAKWSSMRATIAGLDMSHTEDPLLTYLHHVSIVFSGPIQLDDIFDKMEQTITSRSSSIAFLDALASYSGDYAAIVTPSHAKWGQYDQRIRQYVDDISLQIKMPFIRPLMLAVAARFSQREAHMAFNAMVSYVVRFLIAGGSRSGVAEKVLGDAAHAVMIGRIATAQELAKAVRDVVPTNTKFHATFCNKTISSGRQARYILRELEKEFRGSGTDPHLSPLSDTSKLSLEHVLPKNPAAITGWDHFTDEEKRVYCYKLGNLALIDAKDNGAIGDKPFADKRPVIEKSAYIRLTGDIVTRTATSLKWTMKDIVDRQKLLADLAVKRWTLP